MEKYYILSGLISIFLMILYPFLIEQTAIISFIISGFCFITSVLSFLEKHWFRFLWPLITIIWLIEFYIQISI